MTQLASRLAGIVSAILLIKMFELFVPSNLFSTMLTYKGSHRCIFLRLRICILFVWHHFISGNGTGLVQGGNSKPYHIHAYTDPQFCRAGARVLFDFSGKFIIYFPRMETSGFINVQYKDYCLAETCRKARLYKLYPL